MEHKYQNIRYDSLLPFPGLGSKCRICLQVDKLYFVSIPTEYNKNEGCLVPGDSNPVAAPPSSHQKGRVSGISTPAQC